MPSLHIETIKASNRNLCGLSDPSQWVDQYQNSNRIKKLLSKNDIANSLIYER